MSHSGSDWTWQQAENNKNNKMCVLRSCGWWNVADEADMRSGTIYMNSYTVYKHSLLC